MFASSKSAFFFYSILLDWISLYCIVIVIVVNLSWTDGWTDGHPGGLRKIFRISLTKLGTRLPLDKLS